MTRTSFLRFLPPASFMRLIMSQTCIKRSMVGQISANPISSSSRPQSQRFSIQDSNPRYRHRYRPCSLYQQPRHPNAVDQQSSSPRRHRVKECKSFVDDAAGDHDSVGHGTHCASLLLELSPNSDIYVARVCGDGANLLDPEVVAKVYPHPSVNHHLGTEPVVGNHARNRSLESRHHHLVIWLVQVPTSS